MERTILLAVAAAVAGAAWSVGDLASLAGVAAWLGVVLALRAPGRRTRPAEGLTALRRWRTVLLGVGGLTLGANAFAYERLAAQQVDVWPAWLTTLLVAAFAAWIAWTQQEIRRGLAR